MPLESELFAIGFPLMNGSVQLLVIIQDVFLPPTPPQPHTRLSAAAPPSRDEPGWKQEAGPREVGFSPKIA